MLADRYGLSLSTSSQPRRPELWREVGDLVEHTMVAAYLRAGRAEDARQMIARRIARRATVNVAGFSADPTLQ